MPLHRKRKVHQHSSVFDHPNHLDFGYKVIPKVSNKVIMTGGILARRSDDNIGEEDEIDCLVDDGNAEEEELENEDNDGTLMRDTYKKPSNMGIYQNQYLDSKKNKQNENYCETAYTKTYQKIDKEGTLISTVQSSAVINDGTLQNNFDTSKKDNKKLNNGDSSQGPKVQSILEKGKANLSRSKSELGEQHRKVLSQLNKGKSGITEQNKRFLANITSGMGKGKRFVLPGFGFATATNTKAKESLNDVKCPILEENEINGKNSTVKNLPIQVYSSENYEKNKELVNLEPISKTVLDDDIHTPFHKADNINNDLDRMLTNLGIQISAAEAATTESASYSPSSQVVPSLMTQSVFVTSANRSSSMENSSTNIFPAKTLVAPKPCERRVFSRSNLTSSYSSEKSMLSKLANETNHKNIYNLSSGPVGLDKSNNNSSKFEKDQVYANDIKKGTSYIGDAVNKQKINLKTKTDPNSITVIGTDDYLQLERSLENDYGEFDFIDGDGTLPRTTTPPFSSNYGYAVYESEKTREKAKVVSLYDEVFEEINREKNEYANSKENRSNQANVTIREQNKLKNDKYHSDHSNKKNRRLSSSSLSSVSTNENAKNGIRANTKYLNHMGSNASFQTPQSPSKQTSAFIPSSSTNTASVSVYADHTLMLRSHHKRRRWLLMKHTNPSKHLYDVDRDSTKNNQTKMLDAMPTETPNLRRCASLAQNVYSESSSDYSPFIVANGQEDRGNFVNEINELNNIDHVSQKLFLLNGNCSASHMDIGTNNINNDNNNSAKNETINLSWLSKSVSTSVRKGSFSSGMSSEKECFPSTRVQYSSAKDGQTNKELVSNNNTIDKSSIWQRSRRSPWLLRSNLSSYARRRRGSSTSLHTIGINEEEISGEMGQSSSIHPALISQNGAIDSNIKHNSIQLHEGNGKDINEKRKENKVTQKDTQSSLSTETENDSMTLNRR